jgi:hypothetical protein
MSLETFYFPKGDSLQSFKLFSVILACGFSTYVWASDNSTDTAMTQTQEVLRDPKKVQEASAETAEGKKALEQISSLSSDPKVQKEILELTSEVFGGLKGMTPEQMADFLASAQNNPEEFSKTWTPEQQAKLRDLASRLPASEKSK